MTDASVPGSAVVRSIIRYSPPAAAAFAFAIGLTVLAGWAVGVHELTTLGALAEVKANAGLALVLAGVACWFAWPARQPARPWVVAITGAAVSAIGLLTLAEYAVGADLGIDELLVADESPNFATSHPGRMGANTALCFALLGLGVALFAARRRTADRVASALLVVTAAVAFAALGGYALGVPDFYRVSSWTQMAPATAVALVVLAAGTLAGRADFLPMRLLADDGAAGATTRRLLPAAILLPPALAWLSRRGHDAGLYGEEVGDLLLVGSLVAVLAALVLKLAVGVERSAAEGEASEEARRAAEARYRTLVEHLPLVTYATTRADGSTSTYVSPQIAELLGYSPDEWLGDPELLRTIVHPDDRDRLLPVGEARDGVERRSSEYRVVARDGRTVWLRDDAVVERGDSGDDVFVQGFLMDITAQKEAEARLSVRSEQLLALHETAMGVLKGLELDALLETVLSRAAEVAGTQHAYVYLTEGDELAVRLAKGMFEQTLGYRLRPGEGIAGRVYESGRPLVVDDYHAWTGRRRDFDAFRFHAVIGVPLRSGNEVVGVLGLAHDDPARRFTAEETLLLERFGDLVALALQNARLYAAAQEELEERRRTEEALREAEARYRVLVENVPLVIYLDSLEVDSGLIYISPQVESILGYSTDEWLADRELFARLLHPEDRERVLAEAEQGNRADWFSSEYRLVARDGREVWFRDEARHIRGADGKPMFAQGFMLDITEQKRAEQALRESEERFRSLVSNVPGAIYRCTFDSRWRFDFMSGAIEEISGYSAEDFIRPEGQSLNSIVHPDDLPRVRERFEAAARGGQVYELEYRIVHASGAVRWVLERGQGTPRTDGTLVLDGAIFDITERHRAQEELEESRRQLAHAQAVAHVGSWHWDVPSDTVAWSDELYRVYGIEAGGVEMTYASIRDFVHPEDRGAFEAAVATAYETGEPFAVDYRIARPDGSVRYVHARGEVVLGEGGPEKMLGTVHDVTDRKEAEERLRDAEVRYRTLVEHLPLGTYIRPLDLKSGNVYASPQVEEMLGYSVEEWQQDPGLLARIVHPEDRERVLAEAVRVRRTGEPFRGEYRYIARDGRVVWVQDETYVVRDRDGNPYCVQGYLLDITEQKRASVEREHLLRETQEARAALAAQNDRLVELDRLKDEFIALVSHELRTPLTSIRGYLELVLEDELSDEHRRFLEIVERNSERLLRLVTDLLFIAQVEAGKLALELGPLDLAETVAESVEAARPAAESKRIALELTAAPVPVLEGDRARIAQLLDNLVSNAVKFTPPGGRVDVRVWAEGGAARVSIADTGIGIPADEQPQLFGRFFRTSNATRHAIQGTGLGLSISKAIVEAHGGRIAFTSEHRIGTTFTVALPLPAADEPAAEREETAA